MMFVRGVALTKLSYGWLLLLLVVCVLGVCRMQNHGKSSHQTYNNTAYGRQVYTNSRKYLSMCLFTSRFKTTTTKGLATGGVQSKSIACHGHVFAAPVVYPVVCNALCPTTWIVTLPRAALPMVPARGAPYPPPTHALTLQLCWGGVRNCATSPDRNFRLWNLVLRLPSPTPTANMHTQGSHNALPNQVETDGCNHAFANVCVMCYVCPLPARVYARQPQRVCV